MKVISFAQRGDGGTLKREEFRYLIEMFAVRDLRERRDAWTPAVGYMGAKGTCAGSQGGQANALPVVGLLAARARTVPAATP